MGDKFRGETAIQKGHRQALLDDEQPAAIAAREQREEVARARRDMLHASLYGVPGNDVYPIESHWDRERDEFEEWQR